jgi:hypothetical protein
MRTKILITLQWIGFIITAGLILALLADMSDVIQLIILIALFCTPFVILSIVRSKINGEPLKWPWEK